MLFVCSRMFSLVFGRCSAILVSVSGNVLGSSRCVLTYSVVFRESSAVFLDVLSVV